MKLYNKTNHSVQLYVTENLGGITQILVSGIHIQKDDLTFYKLSVLYFALISFYILQYTWAIEWGSVYTEIGAVSQMANQEPPSLPQNCLVRQWSNLPSS